MPKKIVTPIEKTVAQFAIDMRLTTEHLAALSPEQIAAVFDGIAKVTALQHGTAPDQVAGDTEAKPTGGAS